ncbi:MAG TPA: cytochrome c biogenesis protein CcsA [Acidobacteriaceae bacterium]|nr:cytochrome c biogenesis protein CcsA [Acidobacteriaceae bacterium]
MRKTLFIGLPIALAILAVGFYQAIFVAPTEATMGEVQRIFYYHVPSAIMALLFPYVNFAASAAYLLIRRSNPLRAQAADALALAAAEVTLVFASIGLATGMLWGRAAWGIWWTWDARLTSFLMLWLLYVSYLLLRRFTAGGQTQTLAAVLSVFAAIDVPIVYMSIRWWRTQHPSPVFFGGPDTGIDAHMMPAFLFNVAGWFVWGVLLVTLRYQLQRKRQRAEQDATLRALETTLQSVR